jgi:DNA-binding beta-propeller fold protein YncE
MHTRHRLLLPVFLVALSAATAGAQGKAPCCVSPAAIGAPATRSIVWPNSADEPARIAFRASLSSERDIGRRASSWSRFRSMVEGTTTSLTPVKRPYDLVVSPDRRVFVSDGARSQVLVFDPRTHAASFLGETGPGRGRLVKPMGLGVDALGNVYVADQGAKRVVAFTPAGTVLRTYGGPAIFLNPVDVAVDPEGGLVYVADSYLHQIVVFRASDGALLRRIGRNLGDVAAKQRILGTLSTTHDLAEADLATRSSLGHSANRSNEPRDLVENRSADPGEFRYPSFLAVSPNGTLYVSDALNFRVQAFDRSGAFVRAFGKQGDAPGAFARPKGIAVDAAGHLYVADAAFNNVQIFDAQGRLLLAFGQMGRGEGELALPLGLFIDEHDYIYIADRTNDRVQVFQYLRPADAATASMPRKGVR